MHGSENVLRRVWRFEARKFAVSAGSRSFGVHILGSYMEDLSACRFVGRSDTGGRRDVASRRDATTDCVYTSRLFDVNVQCLCRERYKGNPLPLWRNVYANFVNVLWGIITKRSLLGNII